jgi:hypothetical protein
MEPIPGQECHCGESTETERDDSERCDQCGAKLEWTLDLDGVQRRECPNCGG